MRRLMCLMAAAALSIACAQAIEIDDSPDTKVEAGTHETRVIVSGQEFLVTDYSQMPEGGFETYDQVPAKFAGAFARISTGDEIPRAEVINIIDAYFHETAFNYESMKVRKIDISWPKYIAGCSVPTILSLCAARTYLAGSFVTFESNGANRLGGMTGFRPNAWLVRRASAGGSLTDGAGDDRSAKVSAATGEQLRRRLGPEVAIDYAGRLEAGLAASRKVFELHGYTVSDDATAGLVTAARQIKLSAAQADCGSIMGIGFIRDKRAETTVLLVATVDESRICVRLAIDGVVHDNILTCSSMGTLEKSLAAEIVAASN